MIILLPGAVQRGSLNDLIHVDAEAAHILGIEHLQPCCQKTTARETARAENSGQKCVPSRSPAFATATFANALQCERGRTRANQWESVGRPRKTCREVLVDRPTYAGKSITTGLKPTSAVLSRSAADNRRKQTTRKANP